MGLFCVGSAQPKYRYEGEMRKYVKLASRKNIEVLCFPEWFLQSEKSVEKLSELTKEYKIWVVAGCREFEDEIEYNSALILNDHGEIIGKQRKTYLSSKEVRGVYGRIVVGDKLEVFDTEYGRFGIVICSEIACPEVTRTLALKGAEIIFHPTGSGMYSQAQYDLWKGMIQTQAVENLLYFVSSTHNSPFPWENVGIPLGVIVDSGGKMLAEARKTLLVSASIDLDKRDEDAGRGSFHSSYEKMISRRQPKLYSVIARTEGN